MTRRQYAIKYYKISAEIISYFSTIEFQMAMFLSRHFCKDFKKMDDLTDIDRLYKIIQAFDDLAFLQNKFN